MKCSKLKVKMEKKKGLRLGFHKTASQFQYSRQIIGYESNFVPPTLFFQPPK